MDIKEEITQPVKAEAPVVLKFAPAWKRVVAYIIDLIILDIIIAVMLTMVYSKEFPAISEQTDFKLIKQMFDQFLSRHYLQIFITNFIIQASYFTLSWKARGQSVGARIMKIAVITVSKHKLTITQGLIRFVVIFLSSLAYYIPLVIVINPVYYQRLQDVFAGTVVVEVPEIDSKGHDESQDSHDPEIKD